MSIALILLVAAFVVFVIEAWIHKSLLAVGLALWVLSLLIGHLV